MTFSKRIKIMGGNERKTIKTVRNKNYKIRTDTTEILEVLKKFWCRLNWEEIVSFNKQ